MGWGAVSSADQTTIGNTWRGGFTGHEHLDSVALIHMNGRVYDPVVARFLSRDPFIDGVDSSQGPNGYAYVHNNPLNRIDPSGFSTGGPCLGGACRLVDGGGGMEEVIATGRRLPPPTSPSFGDSGSFGGVASGSGESGGRSGTTSMEEILVTEKRPAPLEFGGALPSPSWGTYASASGSDGTMQGEPNCTLDSARAEAARSNPSAPSNLGPGTYPSKAVGFSAGYYLGFALETRYLADFTTQTVHQLSYVGGTLGYRFGASIQWSGGAGNRNFTTISGADAFGWGGSGGASLIVGGGAAVSFDGASWTAVLDLDSM